MHFFPYVVKQPLLGMELKKERKKKEEDIKFKQSSNKQEACSRLEIIFIVSQRKVSTARKLQSSRTWILVFINFYWLTYIKKSQRQNEHYLALYKAWCPLKGHLLEDTRC